MPSNLKTFSQPTHSLNGQVASPAASKCDEMTHWLQGVYLNLLLFPPFLTLHKIQR